MASVIVEMKDGTKREFLHRGRPGGSYTVHVKYEGAFVVITDEWDNRTAIPANDIAQVREIPTRAF